MSRGSHWLHESTGDVYGQLVGAAREVEPDRAARERLAALLQRCPDAVSGRRARPATRLISSVLGWAASAAAAAPTAGKGVAVGATLSVIKWGGVGAMVGLSAVGTASRAGLIGPSVTRPISAEAPFGPKRMTPKAPPASLGQRTSPPVRSSHGPEWSTVPALGSADVVAPPEDQRVRTIGEPMLPSTRPSVVNPVAVQPRNSMEPVERVAATIGPAETGRPHPFPAPTVTAAPPLAAPAPTGLSHTPTTAVTSPMPTSTVSPGAMLTAEVAALDAARDRLRAGDAAGALEVLGDYRQRFPQGALADEASLVGITAFLAMDRRDAASVEAERLLARKPPAALEERIRKLMNVH